MGRMAKMETITRSSGNVFFDLRVAGADEKQTKVRLAVALNAILEQKGLRQREAGRLLRLSQPKISALANYRLAGFSVERLMRLLNVLDHDIEIVIRSNRRANRSGTITVRAVSRD
jgi:predicted XRE-type DNA-binding protein